MGVKIKRRKLFEADAPAQQPANGQQPAAQPANNQQQQGQAAPAFNGQEIINKITNLQVAAVQALQETYKKVTNDIPELSNAAKDTNSPIAKEAKEFMDAITGFANGKADPAKPETITAAMTSYGNIAEKLKVLIGKINESVKTEQGAANNQQQQQTQTAQPVQGQAPQQTAGVQTQAPANGQPAQGQQAPVNGQQPAQGQPGAASESVRPEFGKTLNEKIQVAEEAARPNTFGLTLNQKIRTANFKKMFDNMDVN